MDEIKLYIQNTKYKIQNNVLTASAGGWNWKQNTVKWWTQQSHCQAFGCHCRCVKPVYILKGDSVGGFSSAALGTIVLWHCGAMQPITVVWCYGTVVWYMKLLWYTLHFDLLLWNCSCGVLSALWWHCIVVHCYQTVGLWNRHSLPWCGVLLFCGVFL